MKKTLTADQIAKRDERRAQFKALWKQVAAMGESERLIAVAKLGFVKAKDGGTYSPCNMMLIAMQKPTATVLAGFHDWIKLGRAVRKLEHGAQIFVPIGHKSTAENGDTVTQMDDKKHFTTGTVFDIGQTDAIEEEHPIAVVSPEVAAAFGMADLPNVRVEEPELMLA